MVTYHGTAYGRVSGDMYQQCYPNLAPMQSPEMLGALRAASAAGEAADEALAGMMSPPSGYSSGDEPVPYATAEQAASIQARPCRC